MSDIALDFDDELMRARFIQGLGTPPLDPFAIKPAAPLGLSSPVSSIDEVRESPKLELPRQNIMIRILEAHQETERLAAIRAQNFEVESAKSLAEIQRLEQEKEEAFLKELDAVKSRDTWETFSTVAQYVSSVAAVTLAFSMGGVPGILLGAAGVVGGGVRLLNDTNLMRPILEWFGKSRELQTEIKQNIESYAFYLQMGLGVAGGLAAWQAGYFAAMEAANLLDYTTKASSMVGSASTVMKAGGDIGKAYYGKQIGDYMKESRKAEYAVTAQRQGLSRNSKEIQEIMDNIDSELEGIRKAIQKQEIHQD
ncbi:MAG: hypothetical protein K1X28_00485 [Parachlamydiales bacterium]|nr:hypothetical protein [Parachlamydiales bacterium]